MLAQDSTYLDAVGRDFAPARPSALFPIYWRFAAERQAIFERKAAGLPPPWTCDPILQRYRFTNCFRSLDRVSQYLIRSVIPGGPQDAECLVFRILLFKIFNRISTWQLLEAALGDIVPAPGWRDSIDAVLTAAMDRGERIFSAAYIMPAARGARKHRAYLDLLERMLADGLSGRLAACPSLEAVFLELRAYPLIGDFLAYQYAIDLNYSGLVDFSETDFVVAGPGAKRGIAKCFDDPGGMSHAEIIALMSERQDAEFARLGLEFRGPNGRKLHLIDCQNLFCEVDKYCRVAYPDPASPGKRIKQLYRPSGGTIAFR
jgi:hypothetical protein